MGRYDFIFATYSRELKSDYAGMMGLFALGIGERLKIRQLSCEDSLLDAHVAKREPSDDKC